MLIFRGMFQRSRHRQRKHTHNTTVFTLGTAILPGGHTWSNSKHRLDFTRISRIGTDLEKYAQPASQLVQHPSATPPKTIARCRNEQHALRANTLQL